MFFPFPISFQPIKFKIHFCGRQTCNSLANAMTEFKSVVTGVDVNGVVCLPQKLTLNLIGWNEIGKGKTTFTFLPWFDNNPFQKDEYIKIPLIILFWPTLTSYIQPQASFSIRCNLHISYILIRALKYLKQKDFWNWLWAAVIGQVCPDSCFWYMKYYLLLVQSRRQSRQT